MYLNVHTALYVRMYLSIYLHYIRTYVRAIMYVNLKYGLLNNYTYVVLILKDTYVY